MLAQTRGIYDLFAASGALGRRAFRGCTSLLHILHAAQDLCPATGKLADLLLANSRNRQSELLYIVVQTGCQLRNITAQRVS
ncbi:hypothetical protein D3C78_1632300 [compost metagenome]